MSCHQYWQQRSCLGARYARCGRVTAVPGRGSFQRGPGPLVSALKRAAAGPAPPPASSRRLVQHQSHSGRSVFQPQQVHTHANLWCTGLLTNRQAGSTRHESTHIPSPTHTSDTECTLLLYKHTGSAQTKIIMHSGDEGEECTHTGMNQWGPPSTCAEGPGCRGRKGHTHTLEPAC
jgi:hypothetical protein